MEKRGRKREKMAMGEMTKKEEERERGRVIVEIGSSPEKNVEQSNREIINGKGVLELEQSNVLLKMA